MSLFSADNEKYLKYYSQIMVLRSRVKKCIKKTTTLCIVEALGCALTDK